MAIKIDKTILFDSIASHPKHAIVLIYDLGGFSKFFNQPDVQDYVPKFINKVSNAMNIIFSGGKRPWEPSGKPSTGIYSIEPLQSPIHEKFLGDGALYLWTPPKGKKNFSDIFILNLCNRLWNLKKFFGNILKDCSNDIPVLELPDKIRFGLTRGTIYELSQYKSAKREYIGFCINLASRLQKYCPELGFIASARIGLSESTLKEHLYIKVIATKIKGFPKEIVIVDKDEFKNLDEKIKEELFEII